MRRTKHNNTNGKGTIMRRTNHKPSKYYKDLEMKDTIIYTKCQLEEKLNEKMKKFCLLYIEEYNATRSYMKAYGYEHDESRYFAAAASASYLLKIPKIKQYIEFLKKDIEETVGFSKIKMLKELNSIATADITDVYENWLTRRDLEELKTENPEICKAIKEISTKVEVKLNAMKEPVEIQYVKIAFHDKLAAIREIFAAMGWKEPDKLDITIQPLFPDVQY
jgi:phage terminase small subunit